MEGELEAGIPAHLLQGAHARRRGRLPKAFSLRGRLLAPVSASTSDGLLSGGGASTKRARLRGRDAEGCALAMVVAEVQDC